MRLTVLGKSPAWQDADGACSGYLIEQDGLRLLLDCGNGVFAKLRRFVDYVDVDVVVVSHLHADHFLDLVPFASGLRYAPRQQPVPVDGWPGTPDPARPRLIAPTGAAQAFTEVCRGSGMPEDHIVGAFDLHEYEAGDELDVGPLHLRFGAVPHYLPTHAVDVTRREGPGRLTFGADHAPSDDLVAFAEGTDLLLIEATLPRPERDGVRGHVTAAEAGAHAARAHAARVVLTHISDELDPEHARAEAARTYGGAVSVAAEGDVYEI